MCWEMGWSEPRDGGCGRGRQCAVRRLEGSLCGGGELWPIGVDVLPSGTCDKVCAGSGAGSLDLRLGPRSQLTALSGLSWGAGRWRVPGSWVELPALVPAWSLCLHFLWGPGQPPQYCLPSPTLPRAEPRAKATSLP